MAIAFRAATPFSGNGASPIAAPNTSTLGDTGIVHCSLDPGGTLAVTGVTDNAGGGSSAYSKQNHDIQGAIRGECWTTLVGAQKGSTSTSMAFSGSNTDSGLIAAGYSGVLALGQFIIAKGTGADPNIVLTTVDPNNVVLFGLAAINGALPSAHAGWGTMRVQDGNIAIVQGLFELAVASPGSVTVGCTLGAGAWVGWALELRSVAGGAGGPFGEEMYGFPMQVTPSRQKVTVFA